MINMVLNIKKKFHVRPTKSIGNIFYAVYLFILKLVFLSKLFQKNKISYFILYLFISNLILSQ